MKLVSIEASVATREFPAWPAHLKHTGTAKGLGAFATRRIAAGECVEIAPVLVLDSHHDDLPLELRRIVFWWAPPGAAPRCAVCLGYGGLYNSANPSNLRYVHLFELRAIAYIADRDIEQGEELTINYSSDGEAAWPDNAWFGEHDVQMLP